MRSRLPAALLVAGLIVIPALAQKKKADDSAAKTPAPSANDRMTQLLNESEDLKRAREEMHRFWMNNQPSVLTYEKFKPAVSTVYVVKSYSVGDLVVPPPRDQLVQAPATCEAQLIKKIITAIEPKSWSKAGGCEQLKSWYSICT